MLSPSEFDQMLNEYEQDSAARRAAESEQTIELTNRRTAALQAEQITAQEEADQSIADLSNDYPELLDGYLAPSDFR